MKARLHWDDGRIEEINGLADDVRVIVRRGERGEHHFFRVDLTDPEGFEVFVEDEPETDQSIT